MFQSWKPFSHLRPKEAAPASPSLFVSTAFKSGSYTIRVTDLTHIWIETLDRRAILRRSLNENTSIDPSDGPDQLHIFLEKIKSALRSGEDTTIAITIQANHESYGSMPPSTIVLNLVISLPGGLAPLEWPVYLQLAPQSVLTGQLLVPIMKAQNRRMHEMSSLVDLLGEKDQVIQKLLDKLEAQGIELGQIFPHAVGKLGSKFDRKKADERVKGIGRFDMGAWKRSLKVSEAAGTEVLVTAIFEKGNDFAVEPDHGDSTIEAENWWTDFQDKSAGPSLPVRQTIATAPGNEPRAESLPREDEQDVFQVQSTPPHMASPAPQTSGSIDHSSASDDDDLDAPTQGSKVPDSYPVSSPTAAKKSPKKLGTLKPRNKALDSHALPRPSQFSSDDGSTTEDDEPTLEEIREFIDEKRIVSPSSTTPPPSSSTRQKGKLGKIGSNRVPTPASSLPSSTSAEAGLELSSDSHTPKKRRLGAIRSKKQAREASPKPELEVAAEAEAEEARLQPGSAKRRLGAIGQGKKGEPVSLKVADVESVRSGSEQAAETSVKRTEMLGKTETTEISETLEEKADRKRAQLRRDLEAKAKTPVKKKKKF